MSDRTERYEQFLQMRIKGPRSFGGAMRFQQLKEEFGSRPRIEKHTAVMIDFEQYKKTAPI